MVVKPSSKSMAATAMPMSGVCLEHPQDVLAAALAMEAEGGEVALVIITDIVGGAVRAKGALMAVSGKGELAGYLSGGCIDSDIALQAKSALEQKKTRSVRYGVGSPFVDLPLPCGGAIEILIIPQPDMSVLNIIHDCLQQRRQVNVCYHEEGVISLQDNACPESGSDEKVFTTQYIPKLNIRIAGRGADCLALARLAISSGFEVSLQALKREELDEAFRHGVTRGTLLTSPFKLPETADDRFTAFVLMFHDPEWEQVLLKQALSGDAFYLGAVGSPRTHQRRCDDLRNAGCSEADIQRIHGPIGLVPSLRDASMVSISALAEIVGSFKKMLMSL